MLAPSRINVKLDKTEMNVVKKRSDVVENLITLEKMLSSKKKGQREQALEQILNDSYIIIYKSLGENHFGPACMLGVKNGGDVDFAKLSIDEIKEIKKAVSDVIGTAFTNDTTVSKFDEYAKTLTSKVPKVERTYWRVKDERGKNLNLTEKDLK
ncbi:MAG: hypothetical protein HQ500_05000 [Flavobacteriales bacterium]|nr:hypothetical protein [Flavobacteriales bacterium]